MPTDGYARALAQALAVAVAVAEEQTLASGSATPVLFGLFDRPAGNDDRMLEVDPVPLPAGVWRAEPHRSRVDALVAVVGLLTAAAAPDWFPAWRNRSHRHLVGYAFLAQAASPLGGDVMRWLRARDTAGRYYSIQRIGSGGPAVVTVQHRPSRLAAASPVADALARLVAADPC